MTLPFSGPLVRVRRNRFVLALTALPMVLMPLFVGSLMSGAFAKGAATVAAFVEGVFMSLVAAVLVWRQNPWPRRDVIDVHADATGLDVAGERTPREELTEGYVVPALGETKVVLFRRGVAASIELVAQSVTEARRVLLALGFDASQTIARFRTLSRAFADLRTTLIPIAFVPLAMLIGWTGKHATHQASGTMVALVLVSILTFAVFAAIPSRVTVGADGIEVRWLGKRRFVRHRDIVNATQYIAGFGNSRYTGISLTLESGEEYRIPVGQARNGQDRTRMILERIREAGDERAHDDVDLDPALLARGDRDVGTWMRALRSLGAGANATMRTAPIEAEKLWRIVEDPAGAPLTRAAAAVALTADPAADSRRRLRAAAEATAAPRLRIAIDAAAAHDNAALQDALAELEAEAHGRRDEA